MHVILGIDPGSHYTGFGVLQAKGGEIVHLEHGVIAAPGDMAFVDRLGLIGRELDILFKRVKPDITVVEKVFLGKNADSAFKLGHVRGVCLLAASQIGSTMVEYATRSVKKGVTGNGGATKEQVQMVLFNVLGIRQAVRADASDALALAYYHARQMEVEGYLKAQLRRDQQL